MEFFFYLFINFKSVPDVAIALLYAGDMLCT